MAVLEHADALDARARAAWPTLPLAAGAWAAWLAPRLEAARDASALDGPGLYLACASLAGEPEALQHLDLELRAGAASAFARLRLDPASADEVLQRARDHLLVARDGAPRLEKYSGKGALRDWLRTVCARLASTQGEAAQGAHARQSLPPRRPRQRQPSLMN